MHNEGGRRSFLDRMTECHKADAVGTLFNA